MKQELRITHLKKHLKGYLGANPVATKIIKQLIRDQEYSLNKEQRHGSQAE